MEGLQRTPTASPPLLVNAHGSRQQATDVQTVLVVDDEPSLRAVVRRILESDGYRVVEAESVAAAELVLSESEAEIDLLLTDVLMPGESGVDLASHVAEHYHGRLPVLFMSGFTAGLLARLEVDRPVTVVRKPFTREHLLQQVDGALARAGGR